MKLLKRSVVTVVGLALVLGGLAMMVLPGPGILVSVAGIAVLATEYVWAKKLLEQSKDYAEKAQEEAVSSKPRLVATVTFTLGLLAVGIAMLVVEDVPWPRWDSTLDAFWGPIAGSVMILASVILMTTTVVTLRSMRAKRADSAHA